MKLRINTVNMRVNNDVQKFTGSSGQVHHVMGEQIMTAELGLHIDAAAMDWLCEVVMNKFKGDLAAALEARGYEIALVCATKGIA